MERILLNEERAEIMFLPVRHHSPACSVQIQKIIKKWEPTAILVEGPDNANALIPVMVHEDTKAPFAIYYSYHDKAGKISEEKGHYKCYYPFLAYSPELVAVREAAARGIPAAFIDLSYGDILAASKEGRGLRKEEEKSNYNDDYLLSSNEYIGRLCEKTGLRSFGEFWEKYFELNGMDEDCDVWFSHLLTYCRLARENTPKEEMEEDGCIAREAHMAARIVQWVQEYREKSLEDGDTGNLKAASKKTAKRNGKKLEADETMENTNGIEKNEGSVGSDSDMAKILVITGGFHTQGLLERFCLEHFKETKKAAGKLSAGKTAMGKIGKIPEKDQSVYLMPYSMEAADALNGYASGMPYTGFYQQVWEGLQEGEEQPYAKAVLDLLVETGKKVRGKEACLSTYDEICAWQMAQGLGELRAKPQPGAYELQDAVLCSYVKGEYNIASDMPVQTLRGLMTGRGIGRLCAMANVPPIVQDFEAQCTAFRLKMHSTLETEVTLSIFSEKKHRATSCFFHRMGFLKTEFARRLKGPNLQLKRDKNLIREIWKYKWNTQVISALIDVSVYGATIAEAAVSLVGEELKKDLNAGMAATLLTQVFEMGLTGQLASVYGRVQELVVADTDFYSIADAMKSLMMMGELGGLYDVEMDFLALLHTAVQKLITLLPAMAQVKEERLSDCMDILKMLYQVTGRGEEMKMERDAYYEALMRLVEMVDINAGLSGCIHGILYGCGIEDTNGVEKASIGYLTGTREQLLQTAVFFRGLFYTAKDLIFIGGRLLGILDTFFGQVDEQEFVELLPQLRMAFAYFTPSEVDKIAKQAAGLHGAVRDDIMERAEVLPQWYAYGKELDAYAAIQMKMIT
ncbi:MAG: hypothetical protein K2N63_06490 [Lachnospiraceae bacterium]|nr:hypothetical protein [Lachnospiraceae bacterium]